MGVIKKFDYGRTPPILRSGEGSVISDDDFSLTSTPPSEAEELEREPRQPSFNLRRRDPALLIQRLENLSQKRRGARKARREENDRALQTLVESNEDYYVYPPSIEDFISSNGSPLTKLMTNVECMKVWQYFIAQSEEDQLKYLEDFSQKRTKSSTGCAGVPFNQKPVDRLEVDSTRKDCEKSNSLTSSDERFNLIDTEIKSILRKRSPPLGIVTFLENDVTGVFDEDQSAVYLSPHLSSFERLLLHGVCQYHRLKSQSVDVGGIRRIKVENEQLRYSKPDLTLTEFVEKRTRKL